VLLLAPELGPVPFEGVPPESRVQSLSSAVCSLLQLPSPDSKSSLKIKVFPEVSAKEQKLKKSRDERESFRAKM
jgi:hypothetical protein